MKNKICLSHLAFIFFVFVLEISPVVYASNKEDEMLHQMFSEAIKEFIPKSDEKKELIKGFSDEIKATKFDSSSFAKGDLNNDGLEDAVVISGEGQPYIVAVLKGQKDGSFQPWERSKLSCAHGWHNTVGIKKQSIFISGYYESSAMSDVGSYQFKYRDGKFVLIGEDRDRCEKNQRYDKKIKEGVWVRNCHQQSNNYLTHQSILTNSVEDDILGTKTLSVRKEKLKSEPLQEISQFAGSIDCNDR